MNLRNTWITTHLPNPEGWKAELAWLADPTKWSHVNHRSGTGQGKSWGPNTDVITNELCRAHREDVYALQCMLFFLAVGNA